VRICISARIFFDTNILLFAQDRADPAKQLRRASDQAASQEHPVISAQVLQEFFVAATKKLGVSPGAARQPLQELQRLKKRKLEASSCHDGILLFLSATRSFPGSALVPSAGEGVPPS
jgi:predicted nucleic acid-binding protein